MSSRLLTEPPPGYARRGAFTLGSDSDQPTYGIGLLDTDSTACLRVDVVWAYRSPDSLQGAILGQFILARPAEHLWLLFGKHDECRRLEARDDYLFCVVRGDTLPGPASVPTQAWRVDTAAGRFLDVPVEQVRCVNSVHPVNLGRKRAGAVW